MMRALGKRPPRSDPRTLRLASYLTPGKYPAPPPMRDWVAEGNALAKIGKGFDILGNDTIGDCAFAAMAHTIQIQTAANGAPVSISTDEVLRAYSKVTGYKLGDKSTDHGTFLLDAMLFWRNEGLDGHKIEAFAKVEISNVLEVEAAVNLFGGIYLGVALPEAARNQTIWDIAPPNQHGPEWHPNSWGGHCVACPAYSRTGLVFVTWGHIKVATWEWFRTYTDECYAVLDADWVKSGQVAPNGFDIVRLRSDLAAIDAA